MNLYFLTLACLCAGMLFDPNGFLRMALAASVIHETGHVLVYTILTRKFPTLTVCIAGITLKKNLMLSKKQELIVLIFGPLFNFICAFILFAFIEAKATYNLYFFMSVNICIGVYNLLPIGVLDGSQVLELLIPTRKVYALYSIQKWLCVSVCVILICIAFISNISFMARLGLIITGIYLFISGNKTS